MKKIIISLILVVSSIFYLHAAQDRLYFTSSPGSYIGQGKKYDLSEYMGYSLHEDFSTPSIMQFYVSKLGMPSWTLTLVTPDGTDFHVGMYADAQHYPYQDSGHPGLNLHSDSRSYYFSSGWFEILEFVREGDTVTRADIRFYQYGDDFSFMRNSYERGSLHYEGCVIPEPDIIAFVLCGVMCFMFHQKR